MNLAALYSGGKDSTLAIMDSIRNGHSVKYTISMHSKNPESYMFHYPNIEFTRYQSELMDIEHITWKTKGEKERELADLKAAISSVRPDIDGVVAGGLASSYQYNRIKAINESLSLQSIVPYWKIDPLEYWNILLSNGFKIMLTGVACEGLGKNWLGRIIDKKTFRELHKLSIKHRFHLGFEGGEAESFVLDCPLFKKSLEVSEGEVVWNRDSGFYIIKKIRFFDK